MGGSQGVGRAEVSPGACLLHLGSWQSSHVCRTEGADFLLAVSCQTPVALRPRIPHPDPAGSLQAGFPSMAADRGRRAHRHRAPRPSLDGHTCLRSWGEAHASIHGGRGLEGASTTAAGFLLKSLYSRQNPCGCGITVSQVLVQCQWGLYIRNTCLYDLMENMYTH